jgi:hypothetical protein
MNKKLFLVTLPSATLGKGPLYRVQWSLHSAKLGKWAPESPFSQTMALGKEFFKKK